MTFEPNKFYRTKAGYKAIVYAVYDDVIHGAVLINGCWRLVAWHLTGVADAAYCGADYLNLIGPWEEPLDFDWSCLPKWADRYIAMDDTLHRWFAFQDKPIQSDDAWMAKPCVAPTFWVQIPINFIPKNYTGDWKDSLRMNPKYEEKK